MDLCYGEFFQYFLLPFDLKKCLHIVEDQKEEKLVKRSHHHLVVEELSSAFCLKHPILFFSCLPLPCPELIDAFRELVEGFEETI
jgi:hypothetical protein